jgi:uncharacterized membrane protein YhhN
MLLLSILAFISGAFTIFFEYRDKRFVYFFKPLTMVFMIAIAIFFGATHENYFRLILAGLILSLLGDVFLVEPEKHFVYGLASFLVAQILYAVAFGFSSHGNFSPLSLIAYSFGIAMPLVIFKGVPKALKIPVAFYAFAIASMLCLALNFWLNENSVSAKLALLGAISFAISDSVLAIDKFRRRFFYAKIPILITYFLAQWLIAMSV